MSHIVKYYDNCNDSNKNLCEFEIMIYKKKHNEYAQPDYIYV